MNAIANAAIRNNNKGWRTESDPSGLEHDSEKACRGLDPGWKPVFGKDHAPA
jgi:hypothetical protein